MGDFEIVQIDSSLFDQTTVFFKQNFLRYENICLATNILGSEEAIREMLIWMEAQLKHGISFAARDIETKELLGICINRIKSPSTDKDFEEILARFVTPALLFIKDFLHCLESAFDLFKEWNIECAFDIAFLSVRQDQCGRGLATALAEYSINFAKGISKESVDCRDLPSRIRGLKPQAICSIFTSCYTQKIGEKLGFQTLCKVAQKDFIVGHKSLAYYIDPKHEYTTCVAMRI